MFSVFVVLSMFSVFTVLSVPTAQSGEGYFSELRLTPAAVSAARSAATSEFFPWELLAQMKAV